jgi:hypothetical protein
MYLTAGSKDDELLARGRRIAFFGTLIIWIVLIIIFLLMPAYTRKPSYKTVRITLASTPAAASEPAVSAVPAQEPDNTAAHEEKSVPAAAVREQKTVKAASQSRASAEKKNARKQPVLKKSVEELMAEQNQQRPQQQFDDSVFSDVPAETSTQTVHPVKQLSASEALSGAAGSASAATEPVSSMQTGRDSSSGGTADSSTKNALGKIAGVTSSSSSGTDARPAVSSSISSSGGSNTLAWSEGSDRVMLDPSRPYLTISAGNQNLIDSSRKVIITFRVLAAGNVPLGGIEIRPSSALPLAVQSEIKEQIKTWRFAQAAADGTATFEYSIIKK